MPEQFLASSDLTYFQLRSSEDAFVDRLILGAVESGAIVLAANISRAYVDVNRAATELDPALIHGLPKQQTNPRVAVGLGVLPRVVAKGKVIQHGKICLSAAQLRLNQCYFPYHEALEQLIGRQKQQFGTCHLFDFHSMPAESLKNCPQKKGRIPDIVLGDRFGFSCDRWLMDSVETIFEDAGFCVARNTPFAGGHITQHYGKPRKNVHALQIEINRSLYMNESRIEPLPDFETFRARIAAAIKSISRLGPAALEFAAE